MGGGAPFNCIKELFDFHKYVQFLSRYTILALIFGRQQI